jgi:hypothetical protein
MTDELPTRPEKEASEADLELRKAQLKIIESFGTIDFNPNYDYKAKSS